MIALTHQKEVEQRLAELQQQIEHLESLALRLANALIGLTDELETAHARLAKLEAASQADEA